MKSRRLARRVTSQYHNLRQQIATIEQSTTLSKLQKKEEIAKIKEQIDSIGGINKYQEASVISTQHFQTSKWIIQTLRRLNYLPSSANTENIIKLKTLEVGAINGQLCASPWLDVRAIDINARLPCIEEKDFFTVTPQALYEVVVCSMVSQQMMPIDLKELFI